MRLLTAVILLCALGALACANTPGSPPDAGSGPLEETPPSIQVSPEQATVTSGGAPVALTAIATEGEVTWSLSPEGEGTLSAVTGPNTQYTPPGDVSATTLVTVTATLDGTSVSASARLTVVPRGAEGSISLSPSSAALYAGGASVDFTASATGGTVLWSYAPADQGTLAISGAVARYTPPPGVLSPTPITVSASIEGSSASARATVTVNPSGSLLVTVDDPGSAAEIAVSGPEGFEAALSETTRLTGLAPGDYAVTANPYRAAGPVVDAIYRASVDAPAPSVTVNSTAESTVTYVQQPGTGMLWLPTYDSSNNLFGYPGNDLRGFGGGPLVIGSTGGSEVGGPSVLAMGLAVDPLGNLWASDRNHTLSEYPPAVFANGGELTPTRVITNAVLDGGTAGELESLGNPTGIAFDSTGNLWVANGNPASIVRYPKATLEPDGGGAPDLVIRSIPVDGGPLGSFDSLDDPYGLAFDARGDLWVSNQNSIARFADPGALSGIITPVPKTLVVDHPGTWSDGTAYRTLYGANGLAFDASGHLWIANYRATSVVELPDPTALTGVVDPAPIAVITGAPTPLVDNSLQGTGDIAFDNSGDLWVCADYGYLTEYTDVGALEGAVSPTPESVQLFDQVGSDACELVFDPTPRALPIAGQAL